MANEVEVFGKEPTKARFKMYKLGNHSVWQGKEMVYRHIESLEGEDGYDRFSREVDSMDNENRGVYMVRFYDDETDRIDTKTPDAGMFRFKVVPRGLPGETSSAVQQLAGRGLSYGDMQWIEFLKSERDRLLEENDELKEALAEYEDQDNRTKKKLGVIGLVGEAGQQFPWMQEHMSQLLSLFHKLIPGQQAPAAAGEPAVHMPPVNTTINSMEEAAQAFDAAVKKMNAFYVQQYGQEPGNKQFAADMAKLANLTDKPFIFNAAISQLRSM